MKLQQAYQQQPIQTNPVPDLRTSLMGDNSGDIPMQQPTQPKPAIDPAIMQQIYAQSIS